MLRMGLARASVCASAQAESPGQHKSRQNMYMLISVMEEVTHEAIGLIHANEDGSGLHVEAVWAAVDNIVCDDPIGRSRAFPPAQ